MSMDPSSKKKYLAANNYLSHDLESNNEDLSGEKGEGDNTYSHTADMITETTVDNKTPFHDCQYAHLDVVVEELM